VIHRNDPLERLRAANPVPSRAAVLVRPDPVLFRAITAGGGGRRRSRPSRPLVRLLAPALAVSMLVGGAVAYGVLREPGVPKPQSALCFDEADLEARADVVGVGREGPVAACAELWRRGDLGTPGGEVPPLAECVLNTGVAGVFPAAPGDDVCRRLVAPPAAPPGSAPGAPSTTAPSPPTLADLNDRFFAFRDAVLALFVDSPCVEPGVATATVRRELDRAGLADWRIRSGEFSEERPCATLSMRPDNKEIVLTPATPRR
jgi:hypothetical protein